MTMGVLFLTKCWCLLLNMVIITSSLVSNTIRNDDPDSVTGLTSRQKYLIQSSWAPIKKDLASNGILLLLALFKKYPEEQKHFPLFKDMSSDELAASEKFHTLCGKVMNAVSFIVESLHDSKRLVEISQKIGKSHRKNKIQPISFWRIKEVMLEFFGKFMTKETIEAWDKALQVSFEVVTKEL